MSASGQTRYYTGASPGTPGSDVTGTTVRHKRADNATVDSNNPIPVPASGINFGWRKHSKENFFSSPAGAISNLRWFIGAAMAAGLYLGAWLNAVYTQGTSGDEGGITGYTDTTPNQNTNDASNFVSATPLTVNAGTVLSNPTTGEGSQDYVVTQLGVESTWAGGPGAISSVAVTYRYAET